MTSILFMSSTLYILILNWHRALW